MVDVLGGVWLPRTFRVLRRDPLIRSALLLPGQGTANFIQRRFFPGFFSSVFLHSKQCTSVLWVDFVPFFRLRSSCGCASLEIPTAPSSFTIAFCVPSPSDSSRLTAAPWRVNPVFHSFFILGRCSGIFFSIASAPQHFVFFSQGLNIFFKNVIS